MWRIEKFRFVSDIFSLSASFCMSSGSANVSVLNSGVPIGMLMLDYGLVSWPRSDGWM